MKYLRVIVLLLFALVVGIFVSNPVIFMHSFLNGLTVWAINVLPVLFPFAVLSSLALKFTPEQKFSVTKRLYGISCDEIWLTSLLCGYPIGAKAIADSNASPEAATQISSFCSTAGPVFIIASVGAKMLQNSAATLILVFSHFAAAVINGLIWRQKTQYESLSLAGGLPFAEDFGKTVTNSVLSVLSVGGLIALFYMFADMIKSFLPSSFTNSIIVAYLLGTLEMTNGIVALCNLADTATATILCSGLLGLGGMCVLFQCYSYLGKKNVKLSALIKMKLTQSSIATIFSLILVKICF